MEKVIATYMKMNFLKICLVVLIVNSVKGDEYQVKDISCFKKPLHIHYINGVKTDDLEAKDTLKKIGDQLSLKYRSRVSGVDIDARTLLHKEAVKHETQITFDYTNNRTHLLGTLDVLEASIQRSNLKGIEQELIDEMKARVILDGNLPYIASKIKQTNTLRDSFSNILETVTQLRVGVLYFLVDSFRSDDLKKMYDKIAPKLNDEQQVIVVAHSQGNLFANELSLALFKPGYEGLGDLDEEKAKRFGIMHLASPFGSSFHYNSESVLVKQDKVISGFVSELDSGINANYVLSDQWNTERKYVRKIFTPKAYALLEEQDEVYFSKDVDSYPTYGHSVNDVYLSNDINVSKIGETDFSISMVDLFHDKMNSIASRFPANCEAPVEVDGEFLGLVSNSIDRQTSFFNTKFQLFPEKLGMGFRVEESTNRDIKTTSSFLDGDLRSIYLKVGSISYSIEWNDEDQEYVYTRSGASAENRTKNLNGIVFEEKVYPVLVDGNSIEKGVRVEVSVNDKYDQWSTFKRFVPLCSGQECCGNGKVFSPVVNSCISCPTGILNSDGSCDYPVPSPPRVEKVGSSSAPLNDCDGGPLGGSYKVAGSSCSFEASCVGYDTLVGISSFGLHGASEYFCEHDGTSWQVVERVTSGGVTWVRCSNPEGELSSQTRVSCD